MVWMLSMCRPVTTMRTCMLPEHSPQLGDLAVRAANAVPVMVRLAVVGVLVRGAGVGAPPPAGGGVVAPGGPAGVGAPALGGVPRPPLAVGPARPRPAPVGVGAAGVGVVPGPPLAVGPAGPGPAPVGVGSGGATAAMVADPGDPYAFRPTRSTVPTRVPSRAITTRRINAPLWTSSVPERVEVELPAGHPELVEDRDGGLDEAVRTAEVHVAPVDIRYQSPQAPRRHHRARPGIVARPDDVEDLRVPGRGQPVQLLAEDEVVRGAGPVDDDRAARQLLKQGPDRG